jgi:hypothetical protein
MKKISIFLSALMLIITSLACNAPPEPKADQPIDPFMTWPMVYNTESGTYYQKVSRPHINYIDGAMPGLWTDHELIPLAPLSPEETAANLSQLGIAPEEQVFLVLLPSSWKNEDTNEDVTSGDIMSAVTLARPTAGMCMALIGHMIYRNTVDGVSFTILTGAINAWSNGEITPNVVKYGSGGAAAVQFVYQGVKFLLLFGDSTLPPTLVGPVLGSTLGRMAGSLNNLVVGKGKAVDIVQETIALFKCLKQNWPSSPDDLKRMKDEHNKTYSAKHLDEIPDQFPVPFPNPSSEGLKEDILVTVVAGDFSNAESASMKFLFASGIVVLAAATPGLPDEAVVGAYYLKWSADLALAP